MIACTRCAKDNQDHYKFCLGCGAELPRDASKAAKAKKPQTPPSGFEKSEQAAVPAAAKSADVAPAKKDDKKPAVPSFGGAPAKNAPAPGAAAQAAPAAAAKPATASDTVTCEKCSKVNPVSFKFCGACGHNLLTQAGAAASAPAPAPAASAPAPAPASTQPQRGSLVVIRPDGTEGESFPLGTGTTKVGRSAGGVFSSDAYLSPQHATFAFEGDNLFLTDDGSLNGIYWRVEAEAPTVLEDGMMFRIGQEILRFNSIPTPKSVDGVDVAGSPNPPALDNYIDSWQWAARSATVAEIGQVCLFLASPAASFITGVDLPVTGGAELGYGIKVPAKVGWQL